jgi:RNA polymerase sigma-70 factor (ECF subfamily)
MTPTWTEQSIPYEPGIINAANDDSVSASENSVELESNATFETNGAVANTDRGITDEAALVKMARQGDTCAFGELIRQNYNACLKRARWIIRNRSDAEDEVQNACWKAFQRLDQFRGEGRFSAWLSRIVENQCLMRIREERQLRFLHLDEASESNIRIELVTQMLDPEDELGDQQLDRLLSREISRIPPLLRNVMMLADVEQLPMNEVAARLGLSVPAAKSRLMRARVEMRSRLSKHCGRRGYGSLTRKAKYNLAAYAREN